MTAPGSHIEDAIVGVSVDHLVTSWNPGAEVIYGISASDVVGRQVSDAVGAMIDVAAMIAAGGRVHDTHAKADGSTLSVVVSAAHMQDGFVLVCSDRTAIDIAEQHFTAVVECLDRGVVVLDNRGRVQSANRAARRLLDVEVGAVLDGSPDILPFKSYDDDESPMDADGHPVARARITRKPSSGIMRFERKRDGFRCWVSLTAALLDPQDAESSIVASFSDVTEAHHAGKRLEHAATHDELTGLANRALITAHLDEELTRPSRRHSITVLFIDLDNFKSINDAYGHAVGDFVLRSVALRLTDALGPASTVGRIGGDEFVAVVPEALNEIGALVQRALRTPLTFDDRTVHVAASVGRVVVPTGDTRAAEEVLNAADLDMYQSKRPQARR